MKIIHYYHIHYEKVYCTRSTHALVTALGPPRHSVTIKLSNFEGPGSHDRVLTRCGPNWACRFTDEHQVGDGVLNVENPVVRVAGTF